MTQSTAVRWKSAAGFTLVEMLVSVLVVSLIMGATMMTMTHAMRLSDTARLSSGLNTSLRSAMDVIVRDLSQAGQGLPGTTHHVGIPNGAGTTLINLPVPPVASAGSATPNPAAFTTFPALVSLPTINTGYQRGYSNTATATDTITMITTDTRFQNINVSAASASSASATLTVVSSRPVVVANAGPQNIALGDLIDVTYNGVDVVMAVTGISGQTLTFAPDAANDPLGLNQFGSSKAGSATVVLGATPTAANVLISRVKIISYYLSNDVAGDPRYPRLVRRVNGGTPGTVAFAVENFAITYDLSSPSNTNYAGVSMTNNDINVGNGACINGSTNQVCQPDWVRKINVVLGARSIDKTAQKIYITNTVFSEIAVRSLAFGDKFR